MGCSRVTEKRMDMKRASNSSYLNNKPIIEIEYDEFDNETISHYTATNKTGIGLKVLWQVNTPGKETLSEKSKIRGSLMSQNRSWTYLNCNKLIFIIDGERYIPNKIEHDGNVSYSMDFNIAKRISSAASVRGKLCWNEFEIFKNDKDALANMIKK